MKKLPEVISLRRNVLLTVMVLCLALYLPGPAYAGASPEIEGPQDAVQQARELFPEIIKGKEKQLDVRFREETYREQNFWSVRWNQRTQEGYANFSIRLDAGTGKLYDFDYDMPGMEKARDQVLTRAQAKKKALAFARQHHPKKMDGLQEDPTYLNHASNELDLTYNFRWYQEINGIPFNENNIRAEVDALTGRITGFNCSWRGDTELASKIKISRAELASRLVNQLGLYPCYVLNRELGSPEPRAELEYRLNTIDREFSVQNGKPVNNEGNELSWAEARQFSGEFNISPAPEQKLFKEDTGKGISEEKARQVAASFFEEMELEGTAHRSGSSTSTAPGRDGVQYWEYRLVNNKDNSSAPGNIEVSINTRTGEIYRYYNHKPVRPTEEPQEPEISRREAMQKVREFLDIVQPGGMDHMVMRKDDDYRGENDYDFIWVRLVNGIPFEDAGMRISVNKYTGEIEHFYRDYNRGVTFASTREIISPEKAAEAFQENASFELNYQRVWNERKEIEKSVLVYNLDYNSSIDARTGKITAREEGRPQTGPYQEKLESHWARTPLTLLAESGLLPEPEKFNPGAPVTRREGLRVLSAACDRYYPRPDETPEPPFSDIKKGDKDLQTILSAVNNGILKSGGKLHPGAALTREDLAAWVVNALDYGKVAEAPIDMQPDFNDSARISKDRQNYVAIASGLELMNAGPNGNFRPQAPVTWGELASVVIAAAPELRNR